MQVSTPHDLETTLRADIESLIDGSCRVYMPPLPPVLLEDVDADIVIYPVGGEPASAASDRYDVSVDVYADSTETVAQYANAVRALIAKLPLLETDYQYSNATCGMPYDNHDPRAPQLYRKTFRASVTMPGIR